MPETQYPKTLSEIQRAARHTLSLVGLPSLTEILSHVVTLGAAPAAEEHLAARTAHRGAQAAYKRAHEATVAANIAADNALRMLESAAKFNHGNDSAALLRSLRSGQALGKITSLPNAEQPEVVADYLERMSEYLASGQIPRAHAEEVRATNDALAAAVAEEGAAERRRGETKATFDAAKRRFVSYYGLLVVAAEAELGEEGARALLLRFSRSATDTEADDEDVGDDPTVDERGEAPAV